jgi:hypothetical protein
MKIKKEYNKKSHPEGGLVKILRLLSNYFFTSSLAGAAAASAAGAAAASAAGATASVAAAAAESTVSAAASTASSIAGAASSVAAGSSALASLQDTKETLIIATKAILKTTFFILLNYKRLIINSRQRYKFFNM